MAPKYKHEVYSRLGPDQYLEVIPTPYIYGIDNSDSVDAASYLVGGLGSDKRYPGVLGEFEGDIVHIGKPPEFTKYETRELHICVEIPNMSLVDPDVAGCVLGDARRYLERRLGEQLYDLLEFEDAQDLSKDNTILKGKISVNIRRK